jgi:hypothetical protein
MQTITSLLAINMLKKRKLADFGFIKTIGLMLVICVPTAMLGHLTYGVLRHFASLFISLVVSGVITLTFTILLLFVFDIVCIDVIFAKLKLNKLGKKRKIGQQKTSLD